jgi:hypothetical protein
MVPRKELECVKVISDCMPGRCQTYVAQSGLSKTGVRRSNFGWAGHSFDCSTAGSWNRMTMQLGYNTKECRAETILPYPLVQFSSCMNAGSKGEGIRVILLVPWSCLAGSSPYSGGPSCA